MLTIDGKAIARGIIEGLKKQPKPEKILAAVLVGDDKASLSFVRRKELVARELGIAFELFQFSAIDTANEVHERIRSLSHDEAVGGVILQLPLPARFNRDALIAAIDIHKDVDNLSGRAGVEAPAVLTVKEIFAVSRFKSLKDVTIAVVGKGFLVGSPIIRWLHSESLKVSGLILKTADIETENMRAFVVDADVVITGVGKENLIDPRWLKKGAGIIDFGFPPDIKQEIINLKPETLKLAFYTPTPGGTGPILVAKLFENFYALSLRTN